MSERAAWTSLGVALIAAGTIATVAAIAKGPNPADRARCVERVIAAERRDRPPVRDQRGVYYWTTATSASEVCAR